MERRLVELAMRGDEEAFDLLVGRIGEGYLDEYAERGRIWILGSWWLPWNATSPAR
ncbi:MAG TPA: hypothetical protein VJ839_02665 [Candidatus Limnocylindria bacterium]|nr:hypothetical protein [Candidatus Limnocylindria bacterium]